MHGVETFHRIRSRSRNQVRWLSFLILFCVGSWQPGPSLPAVEPEADPVPSPGMAGNTAREDGPASPRSVFERFKALGGTWHAQSTKGWEEQISFQVIARGSVVVETNGFRGAPDRTMLTMFHMDGERLMLTHYCETRNQPRLVASSVEDGGRRVTFTFLDGTNLSSRDQGHMDQAVYDFIDDDHFSSRWTWFQDGEEEWLEDIVFRRVP